MKKFIILVLCLFPLLACGTFSGLSAKKTEFDIPIIVNPTVEKWLHYFQGGGREQFALYLERSHKYIPMMVSILRQHDLPEDLVYMSMIESGFNPYAFSRARATGPWQFMYATGKTFGLNVDEWVDERRDPVKSTVAAAQYLSYLYDRFDDWYLVAASYNAGEGRIQRAMHRYDTKNFWEMSRHRYLRLETKNYVPKLIAAALISKDPETYGFHDLSYEDPISHDSVIVEEMIDLRVVARLVDSSYKEIKYLNPSLKLWLTPPNREFLLNLPSGTSARFKKGLVGLTNEDRLGIRKVYTVKSNKETLSTVAKNHHLFRSHVRIANSMGSRVQIFEGDKIFIPRNPPKGEKWELRDPGAVRIYVVRNGDSLWTIAKKHRVQISHLKKWNPKLKQRKYIKPGQKIRIHQRG